MPGAKSNFVKKMKAFRELPVTIRTKYYINYNAQSTNAQFVAVSLAPTQAGMGANSSQISAFVDMYRMARIDNIRIACLASGGNSANTSAWVLMYSKFGASAPVGWTDLEGIDISSIATLPQTGVGVPTQVSRSTLKIPGANLSVVESAAGPGLPRWISTQSDTDQTTYGNVYVVFSALSVGTQNFFVEVDLTMSFYQMLDPATISLAWKKQLSLTSPNLETIPAAQDKEGSSPEAEVTESQLLLERLLKKYPQTH